jgi:hypothetical protein
MLPGILDSSCDSFRATNGLHHDTACAHWTLVITKVLQAITANFSRVYLQILKLRDKLQQREHNFANKASSSQPAPQTITAAYIDRATDEWVLPAICVDAAGESYFSEKRVHVGASTGGDCIGAVSQAFPASSIAFRHVPGDYDFAAHCAPRRQIIVSLDAGVDIECSNGDRRVFPAGTVVFVEDTWGKGHRSRAVDGKARHSLFIAVPDDAFT